MFMEDEDTILYKVYIRWIDIQQTDASNSFDNAAHSPAAAPKFDWSQTVRAQCNEILRNLVYSQVV